MHPLETPPASASPVVLRTDLGLRPMGAGGVPRPSDGPRTAREVFAVFLDSGDPSAPPARRACAQRDLGIAAAELASRPRGKSIVRAYDDAWELCVERFDGAAFLSVYRGGVDPAVRVYDRAVPFAEVVAEASVAVHQARAAKGLGRALEHDLARVATSLAALLRATTQDDATVPEAAPAVVDLERDAPVSFGAEFSLRARATLEGEPAVERADLHALLFPGRLRAEVRGRPVDLGDALPYVAAERLLDMARRALDAWERGQPLVLRESTSGLLVGLRLSKTGDVALTLGGAEGPSRPRMTATFPALHVTDVVDSILAFGRALARAILRRDRGQGENLRLSAFRREIRETGDVLREVCRQDARVNPSPEPYRAFAELVRPAGPSSSRELGAVRLRYGARWRALVPGIDVRSTFLCGDRLVVGAAHETFCLARTTGEVLWRAPTERATCVVTPGGLARMHDGGTLAVHDLGTGEVTLRARLSPRIGGPPAGAVVNVTGLPRMLVVTEGERHLVAVDLTTGDARWRYPWGQRGTVRLKRGGKLLYVVSGDSALSALDVVTGSVVWRTRDRLRFRAAPVLDHDALFAVAGGVSSAARLHAVDAFSGEQRWTRSVEGDRGSVTLEGGPLVAERAVAVAVRERHALRLFAYDRDTGAPLWASQGAVAPVGTSWLAIDDLLVGNSPLGELLAVDASTGELRYRHPLGRVLETDVPRRLEPVLRSGALFVPFSDVHVFRPRDGVRIATIAPCDVIPDLLRVDERCDVYIAEESGHLVAFGAGPRLSLVTPT